MLFVCRQPPLVHMVDRCVSWVGEGGVHTMTLSEINYDPRSFRQTLGGSYRPSEVMRVGREGRSCRMERRG